MKVRTNIKAGGQQLNHNQTLKVRTGIMAGGLTLNHNQTAVRK